MVCVGTAGERPGAGESVRVAGEFGAVAARDGGSVHNNSRFSIFFMLVMRF